jgi:FKBP-type peptidyl-prolyl cis-trans isomerase FkpA
MTLTPRPRRLVLFLILAAAAGCDFGTNATPTSPDQSNVAYAQTDLTVGTGIEATNGSTASVQYAAWLYSDSGDHKGQALEQNQFSFVLGSNQVIKGFDQTVLGMKVGGTRRAIIPPSLAYGSTGYQTIPPNAALVFEIALMSVVSAGAGS